MTLSPLIIAELRHDAPYAWVMRDQAVVSPRFTFADVQAFDKRVDNYLDLIRLSTREGQDILSSIDLNDWGASFIHGVCAIEQSDKDAFLQLLDNTNEDINRCREIASALCWLSVESAAPFTDLAYQHADALVRSAAITAMRHHQYHFTREQIQTLLADPNPIVLSEALRLIGDNKLDALPLIGPLTTHGDLRVRFYAIRAALLLGDHQKLPLLQSFIVDETPYMREALMLIYPLLNIQQNQQLVTSINERELSPRIKLYSLALSGLGQNIEEILTWIEDENFAPLAADAFAFITGVDIEEDGLSPVRDEIPDHEQNNIHKLQREDPWAQAHEPDLPWPGKYEIDQWWQENKQKFSLNQRYIGGLDHSKSNLERLLFDGNQIQRKVVAISLALSQPIIKIRNFKSKFF